MKLTKIKPILIGAMILLAFATMSCKKKEIEKEEGGEATVTAKITMGATSVDFKSIAFTEYGNFENEIALLKKNGNLTLFFTDNKNYDDNGTGNGLLLGFHQVSSVGSFSLGGAELDGDGNILSGNFLMAILDQASFPLDFYGTGMEGGSGSVTITELGQNRIKGSFTAEAIGMGGQKISIREGRFDVPLKRE